MKDKLRLALQEALGRVLSGAGDLDPPPEFSLDVPRQKDHGDFACNAAMQLTKRLRRPPRDIASLLLEELGDAGGLVERAEIAGPGFLNIWLTHDRWRDVLRSIVEAGDRYGSSDFGKRERVMVEFVSANPTGPLSTGHGRQAVLGDCIARLLQFTGHDVTREYYFNNGGRQMRVLGQSVRARYLEQLGRAAPAPPAALADPENHWVETVEGLPVVFPKDGYQGEYISEVAAGLVEKHADAWLGEPAEEGFRATAEEAIFVEIRRTLDSMGIRFDVYFNEKSLYDDGLIEQALEDLRAQGVVDEADGAVWLRSEALGLERDRVLVKSTGEPTYLLPDIAYHREKFRRGFTTLIDVLGADHIDQVPYVRLSARLLGFDPERVQLVMHQFVTVTRGGEKVKQSTRKATFITVDELIADVGCDVFRFFMIERKADGHLDFDLDIAQDRNWRKNPAYYVQYAHARTHGIERTAAEHGLSMPAADGFDAGRLDLPEELEIVRKLGAFEQVVARAAESREPHHLAYYLRDVAGLWNPYVQDGARHRVVSDDAELTQARLALALAVRIVLAGGLRLLGVSTPERM